MLFRKTQTLLTVILLHFEEKYVFKYLIRNYLSSQTKRLKKYLLSERIIFRKTLISGCLLDKSALIPVKTCCCTNRKYTMGETTTSRSFTIPVYPKTT
jgi:hypothetical protein